jgi:hypothetical protein
MRPLRRVSGRGVADGGMVAIAAVATTVALVPSAPAWARGLAVGPFLLVLPGYTALRVARPPRLNIEDAALLVVGLSISIVVLSGLVLDKVGPGLTPGAWLVALDLWAAVALVIGRRRTRASSPPSPPTPHRRMRIGSVVAVVVAGALVAIGFGLDLRGAEAHERRERFVELWLVPSGADAAVVGIRSGEPGVTRYRVTLSDGGSQVETWPGIRLAWGRRWQTTTSLPATVQAGDDLVAHLYRESSPRPVRSVHVSAPG